jgi:ornithine lipid ester-linked acyl 2-hydroxylase
MEPTSPSSAPPFVSPAQPVPEEYRRTRRLERPRSPVRRRLLSMKDWLEERVARVSVHGDPPVYDPALFPWAAELEAGWRLIRAELDAVLPYRDQMPSFQDILAPVATITADQNWKTFWLAGIGMPCEENARRCPETMRLLRKIPGMKNAFFSILAPGKHLPAHRGAFNGILRYHLGLLVPEPREQCWIRIADRTYHWTEGKSLIFDDTYNHEVENGTAGTRAVLFVDFARPLRRPYHRINDAFLNTSALAPFLREADRKQKLWEKTFYGGKKG